MRWNSGLIWDHARQQTQGHRNRRRDSWWSPAALKAGNDTIGEHVVPAKLVAGHILDLARRAPEGSRLSVEDLRPLVSLPMAVITHDEDRRLSACGRGSAMPGPVDWSLVTAGHVDAVWARYCSRVTEKEVKLAAGRRAPVDLTVGQELFQVEEFRQHEDHLGRRHGSPLD